VMRASDEASGAVTALEDHIIASLTGSSLTGSSLAGSGSSLVNRGPSPQSAMSGTPSPDTKAS
jgi:hypothetical protein